VVAVTSILYPYAPAVEAHVFVDQSEAEPNASVVGTIPALTPTRESIEDNVAFIFRYAVAVVFNADVNSVVGALDGD
jgi:hypothetical protein